MLRSISLAALLLAVAPLSQAADNGIYLGVGYAQSEYGFDNPANAPEFDDEDGGYKLIAGYVKRMKTRPSFKVLYEREGLTEWA